MAGKPDRLFLAPPSYRRRRLIDAARLLPVFAAFLVIVPPILQSGGGAGGVSGALIYVFGLWALVLLAAAVISRAMTRDSVDLSDHAPDIAANEDVAERD